MVTLLVGVLVVVAGAVGFGIALFGPRPVPQPATPEAASTPAAVTRPSPERPPVHRAPVERAPDVMAPLVPTARTRAAAVGWLALGVVGTAALLGTVLGLGALLVVVVIG